MISFSRLLGTSLILVIPYGCQTPVEPSPIQDMTIVLSHSNQESPASDALKRLESLVKGHPKWEESGKALIVGLQAQKDLEQNQLDLAQQGWLWLLKSERGRIGDWALENWVKTYQKILKNNATTPVLTKILLAETKDGNESPFLKERNLTTYESLSKRIAVLNGSFMEDMALDLLPPKSPGRPTDDPVLIKTAQIYCRSNDKSGWTDWIRSLNKLEQNFWEILLADCRQDQERVLILLVPFVEKLKKSTEPGLLVASTQKLVDQYRQLGERERLADAYNILAQALQREDLKPEHLGLSLFEFQYYKVNQILWGSRYRSLVGDYLTARDLVQRAFTLIDNTYSSTLTVVERKRLEELRAEAYHILAFRISYELSDFDAALIQVKLGSKISHLDIDWRFRFRWYEGFYHFKAGRVEDALEIWEALLSRDAPVKEHDRLKFWIAYAYHLTGQENEAEEWLDELCQDHPFSFYSIAATKYTAWNVQVCPRVFDWIQEAAKSEGMKLSTKIDPEDLRKDDEFSQLLYRAELSIKAELTQFKNLTVLDLHDALRKNRSISDSFDSFLYVSRLLYAVKDFHKAMGLSYELSLVDEELWSQHPDQILIYFPRPYMSAYTRNANRFYLNDSLLLGVSRQESGFRSDVMSPAGAIGLMQLMPLTAQRYLNQLSHTSGSLNISELLKDAETNIRIASAYLADLSRHYQQDLPSILASYNAGEYAADAWRKRRKSELPLAWIESIPFGETQNYVKSVLRNHAVYNELIKKDESKKN